MSPEKPFYVRGIKVSVHHKSLVRIYHDSEDVSEDSQVLFDNITQYLMDEHFVTVQKCRVEIVCI
jgi:hypothetical protein